MKNEMLRPHPTRDQEPGTSIAFLVVCNEERFKSYASRLRWAPPWQAGITPSGGQNLRQIGAPELRTYFCASPKNTASWLNKQEPGGNQL